MGENSVGNLLITQPPKVHNRAGEIAQEVKCLPHNYEDLSLDL